MGGARGESARRVEPSIAGVEESSATSSATHYSDGRRAAGPPCWRSRATLHASGARVDLPSGQPSLEPRRADELTHLQPLACAGRLAPGISVLGTLWRARALEPTFPARRRCSSARRRLCRPGRSSLPPQVCRRKLRHDGGRQRVNAVGSTRGWARRCCQAGGSGAGCCSHEQERVRAKGRAHMVCPHPHTTAPARTPTACGGAPGRRSTRRRGRRPTPRRPAGAEANACTTCRAARRWHSCLKGCGGGPLRQLLSAEREAPCWRC